MMNGKALTVALLGAIGVQAMIFGLEQLHLVSSAIGFANLQGLGVAGFVRIICSLLVLVFLVVTGAMLLLSPPISFFRRPPAGDAAIVPVRAQAILRATVIFSGVLVLTWRLPVIVKLVAGFVRAEWQPATWDVSDWLPVGGTVAKMAIGVYLFLGAPQVVRRQVKELEGLRDAGVQPQE